MSKCPYSLHRISLNLIILLHVLVDDVNVILSIERFDLMLLWRRKGPSVCKIKAKAWEDDTVNIVIEALQSFPSNFVPIFF